GYSFLAGWTVKAGALAHHHVFDRGRASVALFPRAAIDLQAIRESSRAAFRVAIVAKRGATPANRVAQDYRNELGDARDLLTLQAAGAASRTDARAIEHLRGVDITDPGDDALIHDQVLDCDLAGRRSGGQIVGVKLIRERFRAKPFHFAQGGKGGARDQAHDSEAARVIEDQPGTVVESELDMIVATVELRGIEIAVA